jgi:DNA-directed RNA polymerase subunit omega
MPGRSGGTNARWANVGGAQVTLLQSKGRMTEKKFERYALATFVRYALKGLMSDRRNNAHCTIPDDPEQSIYRFIIVAAKRARQLQGGARPFLPTSSKKWTIIAAEEVRRGLVKWVNSKRSLTGAAGLMRRLARSQLCLRLKSKGRTIFSMTPVPRRTKATDGALRAAKQIEHDPSFIESTAQIIDRETGVREFADILEKVIAEAGDLIESRIPELVAQARTALRRYADEEPRPAE